MDTIFFKFYDTQKKSLSEYFFMKWILKFNTGFFIDFP